MDEEKVKELVAALLELELRTHCLKGYYSDRYVTFKVDLTQIDTDTHAADELAALFQMEREAAK